PARTGPRGRSPSAHGSRRALRNQDRRLPRRADHDANVVQVTPSLPAVRVSSAGWLLGTEPPEPGAPDVAGVRGIGHGLGAGSRSRLRTDRRLTCTFEWALRARTRDLRLGEAQLTLLLDLRQRHRLRTDLRRTSRSISVPNC